MSDDLLSIFDEVEKGTVPSIHISGRDRKCPRCGQIMIKDRVGHGKVPPKTVAYISDCPNCGYTCVFKEDLM